MVHTPEDEKNKNAALENLVHSEFLKLLRAFIDVRLGVTTADELNVAIENIKKLRTENPDFELYSHTFMEDGKGWYELAVDTDKYQLKDSVDAATLKKMYSTMETNKTFCNFDVEVSNAKSTLNEEKGDIVTMDDQLDAAKTEFDQTYLDAKTKIDQQQEAASALAGKNENGAIANTKAFIGKHKNLIIGITAVAAAVGVGYLYYRYHDDKDVIVLDDIINAVDNSELF